MLRRLLLCVALIVLIGRSALALPGALTLPAPPSSLSPENDPLALDARLEDRRLEGASTTVEDDVPSLLPVDVVARLRPTVHATITLEEAPTSRPPQRTAASARGPPTACTPA